MSMKITLAAGYLLTTLLGSACPTKLVAAMPIPGLVQHTEMIEIAMTPIVPMTLAAPMMVISAHPTMPLPFSGNCQTGHCMVGSAYQQLPPLSTVSVQLAKSAAPHSLPPFSVLVSSVSLPAPPLSGSVSLAQIIATVVLRV